MMSLIYYRLLIIKLKNNVFIVLLCICNYKVFVILTQIIFNDNKNFILLYLIIIIKFTMKLKI